MATKIARPTADYANNGAYLASTGSNKWALVDEESTDDDSEYVYKTAANPNEGWTVSLGVPAGATISKLTVYGRIRKLTSGGSLYGLNIWKGTTFATDHFSAASASQTTSYVTYSADILTNPWTSNDWTVDEANGVGSNSLKAIGTYGSGLGSGETQRVTQAYVEATYTEAAASGKPHYAYAQQQ